MGTSRIKEKVIFLAAEVTPFAKAGGLADVAGSLPIALRELGMDVRVMMPKYSSIDTKKYKFTKTIRVNVPFDGISHPVRVFEGVLPGTNIPVYLVDHPHYEGSGDIYYQDISNSAEQARMQVERFAFLSVAAAYILPALQWTPDIVHCHDWHSGLFPLAVQTMKKDYPLRSAATVYTIHNLPLQGSVPAKRLAELLNTPTLPALLKRHGMTGSVVNCTVAGITLSDIVSTVSPSYAKEIMTPEFGAGCDALLRKRKKDVFGVLNGIDLKRFNPGTDPALQQTYTRSALRKRDANSKWLRAMTGITAKGPLMGMVSRLTEQKGVDLLCQAMPALLQKGFGLVVLGSGDPKLEEKLASLARQHPDAVWVKNGFDAELAQRIYAGSDLFAMPSQFEPCGLGQMIAMRYGSIPVVHATGGLKDTVKEGVNGNGFVAKEFTAASFTNACLRALKMFSTPRWTAIQKRGMQQDFSWKQSALQYQHIYSLALKNHGKKRAS